jgi:urease accessory protein
MLIECRAIFIMPYSAGDSVSDLQRHPVEGILRLGLRCSGERTILYDCYARTPLRVLRPLYLDDTGMAYLYLLNPCGGVVGGDTYTLHITLDTGAQAYVTTPSATQLYATLHTPAEQYIDLILHPGTVLTYFPEQTIPFANAAFRQCITVRLGRDAFVFLGDILAPGRSARQETFAYREYDSRLWVETLCDGEVRLFDHMRLQPQHDPLSCLGLMEAYDYLGVFYALPGSGAIDPSLADRLHDALAQRPDLVGSASTLPYGGLAVRLLGRHHTPVRQALHTVWDLTRQALFGQPAAALRT